MVKEYDCFQLAKELLPSKAEIAEICYKAYLEHYEGLYTKKETNKRIASKIWRRVKKNEEGLK